MAVEMIPQRAPHKERQKRFPGCRITIEQKGTVTLTLDLTGKLRREIAYQCCLALREDRRSPRSGQRQSHR